MRTAWIVAALLISTSWVSAQETPRPTVREFPIPEHVRPVPEGLDLTRLTPEDLGWGANDEVYPDRRAVLRPHSYLMVWVPAGSFTMGGVDSWPYHHPIDTEPPHDVEITNGFWVGRCEVTMQQFADFLNEFGAHTDEDGRPLTRLTGDAPTDFNLTEDTYTVPAGEENLPAHGITWYGALAWAQHYGMRLPTEAEWEYAARGPESHTYPWGEGWNRDYCVNPFNRGGNGLGGPLPVGSVPEGRSWCGAMDMAGNVAEWVRDWYAADYYGISPAQNPPGPSNGEQKVLRGRSHTGNEAREEWRSALRQKAAPEATSAEFGFRAVVVPTGDSFQIGPVRPLPRDPRPIPRIP
ncbi:MAG: SUMF1/EgtB/PvdO family nonheme iron enzyme [Armatimonadota bacterium]